MNTKSYIQRHIMEGIHSFNRNGWMTVMSVSSLAFTLFLVGVTCLLSINLNYMTSKVEQNVEIHLYLQDTNADDLHNLTSAIDSIKHVRSVEFISKNEGLKSFMKTLGDEGTAFQTLKNDNPLNDELIVKTEQPQDVTTVAKKVEKLPLVEKVEYAKNVVGPLVKTTKLARVAGVIFILILTFIAIHLVTNTIKITVLARKEEIQLRKLIGATNYFIRIPFFIEGSLIGFSGAFIASLLIGLAYYFIYSFFNKHIDIALIELIVPYPLIPASCVIMLIFGVFIGMWGANASLRRILKI